MTLNIIQQYAIKLVVDGAESLAEDDLDEDGEFKNEEDHEAACEMAIKIAHAIKNNPELVLALVGEVAEGGSLVTATTMHTV